MVEAGPTPATRRVDFYVLAADDAHARLTFACRIAEKVCLAGQRLYIWVEDAAALQALDELLWTFGDGSFVAHETYADAAQWQDTPVLLGQTAQPAGSFDVLLNLGATVPAAADTAARVVEIIDANPQRRHTGRERFRHYRERGVEPATHHIGSHGGRLNADLPHPHSP